MITKRNRQLYLNRKRRIRKKLQGTAERPRLTVFRSARHIYVQAIDDEAGKTLAAAGSRDKDLAGKLDGLKKGEVAEKVGTLLAERCMAKNIKSVIFDRNGFIYHGRVAKLADAARKQGLVF